jgi:hypothetical protein
MDTSDVSAVSHIAAVSQAVRTNHRQHGYRVLEDVPSTLFPPSFQSGFRMRRADGTMMMAPFVELADIKLPHQCSICTCTQMQDAGSRHTARARSAAAAPIAAFAVPLRT